jgi:hypothetical protein
VSESRARAVPWCLCLGWQDAGHDSHQSDLIARAVREMDLRPADRAYVAQQLATALATTNARFDRGRFITAACPACQKMPAGDRGTMRTDHAGLLALHGAEGAHVR